MVSNQLYIFNLRLKCVACNLIENDYICFTLKLRPLIYTCTMKLLLKLPLLTFVVSTSVTFAQTGPGGVGDNTTNVLWLDAHTMGGANGSSVNSWTDYSGNANNATESDPTFQPIYSTGSLNGRNTVEFNGAQYLTTGANALMNNATYIDYYVISEWDNVTSLSIPFNIDYGSSDADAVFAGIVNQNGGIDSYGRKSVTIKRADFSSAVGQNVYQGVYDKGSNEIKAILNFNTDDILVENPLRSTSTHEEFWIGGTNSFGTQHYYTDGRIGEIFVFTTELNSTQQNIVQNYLSAKFGVAAPNDMYTFEGTYGLGVVGIGQDAAATAHTDSQGNGMVRISSPDDLQDGEYLFVGHDDVEVTSFNLNTNVPTVIASSASRFVRQWRAEKTGNLGNITLKFDLDASTNFSGDPNNYRLLIHSSADMSGTIDHIIAGTYNAGEESITFTNVDLNTGDFFTLAGDTPEEIHSITDGGWNTPGTWDCTCIPTAFNEVYIDPGTNVTVDVDANVYGLYVEAGGNLIMNAPFTLNIFDAFEIANTGTIDFTDGKVAMVGNADQGINAFGATVDFHDLEINNSTGSNVDLFSSVYQLNGSLLMEKGHLVIDNSAGGLFVVRSTSPTTSGRIGEIKTGTTISGNVRVERFIPAGNAEWRNLSSPVSNTTLADWDEELFMSGTNFPDGCAYGASGCFHSVKIHTVGVSQDITNINTALIPGRAYEVFVGDDLNTFSGATINVNGQLHPSTGVSVTINHDWNTVGNPFASPILFSSIPKSSQMGKYFYVYDAVTGGYQWYDESSNTSSIPELANGLLASGQGFWTNGSGVLNFQQTHKVDQSATFIRNSEAPDRSIYLTLNEMNSTYSTTISFEESMICLDGFDTIQDVRHLSTGLEKCPTLAIKTSEDLLRKNWINSDIKDKTYDLHSNFLNPGYYTIEAANLNNFNNYRNVMLYDSETKEIVNLKMNPNYTFYAEIGESSRFRVIFSNALELGADAFGTASVDEMTNELTIIQMNNVINLKTTESIENASVILYSSLGQEVIRFDANSLSSGDNLFTVPSEITGVHILSIFENGTRVSKKLVF